MKKRFLFGFVIVAILAAAGGYYYWSTREEPITDARLLEIKSRGKLLVAAEATYEPMEYLDENGEMVGFDMDLARGIANSLGVAVEFVNTPWDDIFTNLNAKQYDMIVSSVTILPERLKDMSFSDPYFNAGQTMIVTKTNTSIKSPQDLVGKKVGLQKGTTSEPVVITYAGEDAIVDYNDYGPAPQDLRDGKIDVIVIDYPAGLGIIGSNEDLKMVGDPFTQEFYGVAIRKEDTALISFVNKTIRTMKQDGSLKTIEDKWFK